MEDYLQPLKLVKDKVRSFTGFICVSVLPADNNSTGHVSRDPSELALSILPRCFEVISFTSGNVQFIKPQLSNNAEDPLLTNKPLGKDTSGSSCLEKRQQRQEHSCHTGPGPEALSIEGATLELLEAVLDGEVQNGIVLNRFAYQDSESLMNSVVLTVQKTLRERKEVNKVFVVAWDVSHEVETQQPFYDDPRVCYFSINATREIGASALNVGEKSGRGYNINVSYGINELSDADYLAILHNLLLPMAYEYNPDLVLILGDGNKRNGPLFAHVTNALKALAHGKVVAIVQDENDEGCLPDAAISTLRALVGQPCPISLSGGETSENVRRMIMDALNAQRPYWKCLRSQGTDKILSSMESSSEDVTLPSSLKKRVQTRIPKIATPPDTQSDSVALIYDERMLAHYSYTKPHHVERPERMKSIYNRMLDYGLVDRCRRIEAQMATKEQILMLHEPAYLELISRAQCDEELIPHLFREDKDTVSYCPDTYELSLLAAGSSIKLIDAILDGKVSSGMAVIRPPGHHAEAGAACGFCVFNNTALAAKHAIEKRNLSRILIVDWDIHHGNGIQHMFLDDPRVLYISLHIFNDFPFLPEIVGSNVVGDGAGMGFNVNIPWSQIKMGDPEYLSAFFNVILPMAYEFQPELVLVACGFDGARGDPLGRCNISPETYGHFANFLKPLANGRLALMLEGGYSLESVSYGMTMIAKALLGDPLPRLRLMDVPHPGAREDIRKVKKAHEPYWRCLQYEVPASVSSYVEQGQPAEPQTLKWCPDLDCLMPFDPHPNSGVGYAKICSICGFFMPNSSCLTCYETFCIPNGYDGHSRQHYVETGHTLAFNYSNLKVWCHKCESYVEHPVLEKVNKRAHWERYGEAPCSCPKLAV